MASRVRITGGNIDGTDNEGHDAQVDKLGNLRVREGHFDFDNESYEDATFTDPGGAHWATHDFETDAGRCSIDGWISCDGPGNIQVKLSRGGVTYGTAFTMKPGEVVDLLRYKISKIAVKWIADSAYRIFLI